MSLKEYQAKRRFGATPEPEGELKSGRGQLQFVIQCHHASHDHFDFRLEVDGVMKSWAVPKGPSLNPNDQRLAVLVEDHPFDYNDFEGIIPPGNYGAGTVMIWDRGTYIERSSKGRDDSEAAMRAGLKEGHVTVLLSGHKLAGEFALVLLTKDQKGKNWLLIKKRDDWASYKDDVLKQDRSVATGRSMEEIASQAPARGEIWRPGKGPDDPATLKRVAAGPAAPEGGPKRRTRKPPPPPPPPEVTVPTLAEAPAERLPRDVKPMLFSATSLAAASGPDWIMEARADGKRALAFIDGSSVRLKSRQNLDFTKSHAEVAKLLARPKGTRLVLDGEIVGETYVVFDLLHLDGKNLRVLPLAVRKQALGELGIFSERIRLIAEGAEVARHKHSSYEAGVSRYWIRPEAVPKAGEAPQVHLTHLDRIYFPADRITKGDVVEYYRKIAPFILPHLKDRPQSLNRHPNGIDHEGFFQKDMSGYLPPWAATTRVDSPSSGRSIDYLICDNEATLLYMANLGCIEINPWLSRVPTLDAPDATYIDLDPDEQSYDDVVTVALAVKRELDAHGIVAYCKTSGASGMHIGIPLLPGATYDVARAVAEAICRRVEAGLPRLTTTERQPNRRGGRLYLDYMQNRRGATLASAYCLRPRPGATASAPLSWDEVRPGLHPKAFTLNSLPERAAKLGDLWLPMLTPAVTAAELLSRLSAGP